MHTNERKSRYHTQKKSPPAEVGSSPSAAFEARGRQREGRRGEGWREEREIILALSQIWRRIQFCSCAIHTRCHWRTAADPRAWARTNNSDSHGKKRRHPHVMRTCYLILVPCDATLALCCNSTLPPPSTPPPRRPCCATSWSVAFD